MLSSQTIISTIKAKSPDLQKFGIKSIGLYGSTIRGENNPSSDLDVILDFDAGMKTYKNFIGTTIYLENLFGCNIDAVTNESISPYLKPKIEKSIQYVKIKY